MGTPHVHENQPTVDITPHWPGLRNWVHAQFKTDPSTAIDVNRALGSEAAIPLRND